MVYSWQRKWILWTRFVEASIINTHSPFPAFFRTRTGFANHSGWYTSLMNPAASSLAISSPMALRFSSSKRRRRCFTGLEPGRIWRVCSATSLGMPGISEGFHAKMSLLARRKSTSALSYAEESAVPMRTVLPSELLGSTRTSLEPSADSNDPVDFFASGVFSAASSLRAASSLEATTAAAWPQHSISH